MKNTKNRCIIFAGGDYTNDSRSFEITHEHYIIAADCGYKHALKCNCVPDLLIGDFDSLDNIPDEIERITYPKKKDETDTHIAIDFAISKGFNNILVLGALGGERFDHTFANIQSGVHFAKLGVNITLTDGHTYILFLHNEGVSFSESMEGYISIFSASEKSIGVNITGLEYELKNNTLTNDCPLGISNTFIGSKSKISVSDGTLIIIYKR